MIAALPLGVFVVMLLFLAAMSAVAVFAGVHARRQASLVKSTPTTPIALAADGFCELEGVVDAIAGRPVTAPLTGWPCCWYHARLERYVSRPTSGGGGGWQLAREWTSGAPFFVRDGTGVCIVDPFRAEVTPTDRSRWYGDREQPSDRNPPKVPPTESLDRIVEVAGAKRYRYTEERIYAGDPLLVLGEFSKGIAESVDDDDDDDQDDDDDEMADAEAAAETGSEEEDESATADLERDDALFDAARAITRRTIARGTGAKPFIVTTTPQAQHLALTATGSLAAFGVALVPLAIALLLIWARTGR
ncbi:MAG: hypothetical protein IT184_17200 [Acidobacteria bacterium]|nr:hypothetical protein [Acidobacteriota bacterium]